MRGYLQYYQVETEFRAQLGFTVTNILNTATEEDCDLIALSASHHGRLYELTFSGHDGNGCKTSQIERCLLPGNTD